MVSTISTLIGLVLGFWSSLYLIDSWLRSSAKYGRAYVELQDRCGITVSLGQVRYFTDRFNRTFLRLSRLFPYTQQWFTAGAVFGLFSLLASTALLAFTLVKYFKHPTEPEQQVLTPVFPGINLPLNQLAYFITTLLVSAVLHEIGHALAAVRENVRVNGFGVFMFLLYPGAFVDLHTDDLQTISPFQKLRIYSAGVWHNAVIMLCSFLFITALPVFSYPFYKTGDSVVVTYVDQTSPVFGVGRGLMAGYQVSRVGSCDSGTAEAWLGCLTQVIYKPSGGYCMTTNNIREQRGNSLSVHKAMPGGYVECCKNSSHSNLCFHYQVKGQHDKSYACLPARSVVERLGCQRSLDCGTAADVVCVAPSIESSSRLVKVVHDSGKPMIYVGDPWVLAYSVRVNDQVPRWWWAPLGLPEALTTFCQYLASLSGALAVLNAVPCYALDGQWTLLALLEWAVKDQATRDSVQLPLVFLGTLLVFSNVAIALWSLVLQVVSP